MSSVHNVRNCSDLSSRRVSISIRSNCAAVDGTGRGREQVPRVGRIDFQAGGPLGQRLDGRQPDCVNGARHRAIVGIAYIGALAEAIITHGERHVEWLGDLNW